MWISRYGSRSHSDAVFGGSANRTTLLRQSWSGESGDVRIICENGVMLDNPKIISANSCEVLIDLNRWVRNPKQ